MGRIEREWNIVYIIRDGDEECILWERDDEKLRRMESLLRLDKRRIRELAEIAGGETEVDKLLIIINNKLIVANNIITEIS